LEFGWPRRRKPRQAPGTFKGFVQNHIWDFELSA
jgi:hypothetical protein